MRTTAVSGSPFFVFLTDDGSDTTLNEDYSAAPVDAYWDAPGNAHIHAISISMGEDSIAISTAIANTMIGTGSTANGLKFGIKNPSGTLVQDLSVTSIPANTVQVLMFGSSSRLLMGLSDAATQGNNEIIMSVEVNCIEKFGGVLSLPEGYRFVCTLESNYSGLAAFNISLSGVYV